MDQPAFRPRADFLQQPFSYEEQMVGPPACSANDFLRPLLRRCPFDLRTISWEAALDRELDGYAWKVRFGNEGPLVLEVVCSSDTYVLTCPFPIPMSVSSQSTHQRTSSGTRSRIPSPACILPPNEKAETPLFSKRLHTPSAMTPTPSPCECAPSPARSRTPWITPGPFYRGPRAAVAAPAAASAGRKFHPNLVHAPHEAVLRVAKDRRRPSLRPASAGPSADRQAAQLR